MNGKPRAVIVRAHLLDKRERQTGRMAYAFLVVSADGGTVLERPYTDRELRAVVAFAKTRRKAGGCGRITFDAPGGVDRLAGGGVRRYEALSIHEIFYASSALGQS